MNHDAEVVPKQMAATDRGVPSQMSDAKRRVARAEPETATEEVAVDGGDAWLTGRGHGPDHDVLHADEVLHDLPSRQAPVRRDDRGRVRAERS
jgi:hypothetical protein